MRLQVRIGILFIVNYAFGIHTHICNFEQAFYDMSLVVLLVNSTGSKDTIQLLTTKA